MSNNHIAEALALHGVLINPERKGLAGTIALKKLKRLLKKNQSPTAGTVKSDAGTSRRIPAIQPGRFGRHRLPKNAAA